tara:strand:- start:674 stop:1537 length:864 start_codon:yes stop_codon:yes gene_type:complete
MINSMTGYSYLSKEINGISIEIEIKSLNSKFFDYNIKIPKQHLKYENKIKIILKEKLLRGKIDFNISIKNNNISNKHIDKKLFKNYFDELKSLSKNIDNIENEIIFNNTLKLYNLFPNKEEKKIKFNLLNSIINKGINKCINSRKIEGKSITTDIKSKIKILEKNLKSIITIDKKRNKIKKKYLLKEILKIKDVKIDNNRLEQELFYFLDKIDINEEIIRLKEHIHLFKQTLGETHSQGKKLNFISQEIGREINTIGSKCNNFNIQKNIIYMKDSLEKIKEQLYNVL